MECSAGLYLGSRHTGLWTCSDASSPLSPLYTASGANRCGSRRAASRAGISAGYMCDLEHGRRLPRLGTVERLEKAIGLPPRLLERLRATAAPESAFAPR
ncbi:MAG TPA: helix-turn-helix transcriptional regulator [Candidatus Micrarchaeaceae archaeon]|nr:helix-turn-helix transcriptional regulator [Candidatus Micrarchaeaceae archaeon]